MNTLRKLTLTLTILCIRLSTIAQSAAPIDSAHIKELANKMHSHNDYKQNVPFMNAYHSFAGSIEADVFLRDGKLYVAHTAEEIRPGATLDSLYLRPLAACFRRNGGRPYPDKKLTLQLVIDIKEDHEHVIPVLLQELKPYNDLFNEPSNNHAVRIVLSGDMPEPINFKNYPGFIYYDGRPYISYTKEQLARVAMISDAITNYTKWNGLTGMTKTDRSILKKLIKAAHAKGKPFRFWATQDTGLFWKTMHQLDVDWINTDHPGLLYDYYASKVIGR